jgi:hypothetical protein
MPRHMAGARFLAWVASMKLSGDGSKSRRWTLSCKVKHYLQSAKSCPRYHCSYPCVEVRCQEPLSVLLRGDATTDPGAWLS